MKVKVTKTYHVEVPDEHIDFIGHRLVELEHAELDDLFGVGGFFDNKAIAFALTSAAEVGDLTHYVTSIDVRTEDE